MISEECWQDYEVYCDCHLRTPMKVCKNGKNKGRCYWGCVKFPNKEYNFFFEWADERGEISNQGSQYVKKNRYGDKYILQSKKLKKELRLVENQLLAWKISAISLAIFCVILIITNFMSCTCNCKNY